MKGRICGKVCVKKGESFRWPRKLDMSEGKVMMKLRDKENNVIVWQERGVVCPHGHLS